MGRQLQLTLSRPGLACQTGAFPVFSGSPGQLRDDGPFLEAILPPCRECIVPGNPNGGESRANDTTADGPAENQIVIPKVKLGVSSRLQFFEQGFEAGMLTDRPEVGIVLQPFFLDGPELDRFLHALDRFFGLA
jgi:hypothetical protein